MKIDPTICREEQMKIQALYGDEDEDEEEIDDLCNRDSDIKEIVICSAVKSTDGRIFRGHRHADCIQAIKFRNLDYDPSSQGFITSLNRFVDRKEGCRIQIEAGIKSVCDQEPYLNGELYSEDLY